jgi:hypothetical protein
VFQGRSLCVALLASAALAAACVPLCAQESALAADFRGEGERFDQSCIKFSIGSCADLLFTDHPLHLAVGSLAPGNGFGSGLAFVAHYTPNEDWRFYWDADAVVSPNLSWRAGVYMTGVLIRHQKIIITTGPATKKPSNLALEEMPVFHVYGQGISLNQIGFYGLGQGTPRTESLFGMTESIVGGNVVWPLWSALNLSLLAEVNGRFFSLRGSQTSTVPSLEQTGNESTAPGLINQPGYAQLGEGIRLSPSFARGYVRLVYTAKFQQWIATQSGYTFQRFTADLSHQFPLYSSTRSLQPHDFNGPDDCSSDPSSRTCPPISRNLEGSFGFRFLYTASFDPGAAGVPFYLDPTLGGSDINGTTLLPSYADYRFRGPDLMLLRGTFEHSIGKFPVGIKLMLDEGRVGLKPGDLGFSHLAHSYAAGITLHAGGLPLIDLLFAWGGHEGTHTVANISTSLLGGTSRPSLF